MMLTGDQAETVNTAIISLQLISLKVINLKPIIVIGIVSYNVDEFSSILYQNRSCLLKILLNNKFKK